MTHPVEQHYSDATTLPGLVRDLARLHGPTEAVVGDHSRVTYEGIDAASADLALRLLTLGVGKGSRVGILLPNGARWLETFFAVGRIGGVALPLSTLAQAPELSWLLKEAAIEVLVVAASYRGHDYLSRLETAVPDLASVEQGAPIFSPAAPRLRHILVLGDDVSGQEAPEWSTPLPEPAAGEDLLAAVERGVAAHDPLVIIHTSGSTADPKGVIHSHGGFIGHTGNMARGYVPQGAGDRICSPRPWFWVAGLAADLFYALHSGCSTIVPPDGEAGTIAGLVQSEELDYVGGSLPVFRRLSADPGLSEAGVQCLPLGIDLAGVAERGPDDQLRFRSNALEQAFPAARAVTLEPRRFPNLFGMTETIGSHSGMPHCTQVPEGREGTSGAPVLGMERRVVDPETRRDVEPGGEGELLVRGSSLMLGLDRRDPREVFDESGWYATGDLCRIDDDGWITFRSRLGDMVKVSGANVAPLEVERVLHAHPVVEEAAVVGLESDAGTVLTAFVIVADGETLDVSELQAWLRTQLSSYKVPKLIEVIGREDMPRTGSGKVRKHELRARDLPG
jgi:acyl-coenzyme A synthetase/AMP-(fatty) acid ligase